MRRTIYEYVRGEVHTNTIENVWSLLKRSIMDTFHHVNLKHLDLYVDELAWRINHRDEDLFMLTLRELVRDSGYMRYEDLVA